MKRILSKTLVIVALCGCQGAFAQVPRPPGPDPIGEQIFPPELILQHQRAIGLSEAQRATLVGEVKKAQGTVFDRQVELQRNVERLIELLKPDRIDEQQALAQLDLVLGAEREVKRQHIGLAVRLKNLLTPEQIRQLRSLRDNTPR